MLKQTCHPLPAPKALTVLIGLTLLSSPVSANDALLAQYADEAGRYFGVNHFGARYGTMPSYDTFGYANRNLIVINPVLAEPEWQRELAETICHETRHVWQYATNFRFDYSLPYWQQPHEIDARSHQKKCADKIMSKGLQQSPVEHPRPALPLPIQDRAPRGPLMPVQPTVAAPAPVPTIAPIAPTPATTWQTPNWLIGLAIVAGIAGALFAFSKPVEQPSNGLEWLQNKVSTANYQRIYNGFVLVIGGFVMVWAMMSVGLYYHINPAFLPYPLIRLLMAIFLTLFALLAEGAMLKFVVASTLVLIGITI